MPKSSLNLDSAHFTDLIVSAQTGDQDAYNQLVKRFQGMVYIVADNMVNDANLAEDIAQEVFLEAYVQLHQLREPKAFPAWLRRITVKQVDRVLRKKQLPTIEIDDALAIDPNLPDPALAFERIETRRSLKKAIYHLPKIYRIPVVLFYMHGYTQHEIADFLSLPVGTVKKRLYDSREKLKDLIVMDPNNPVPNNLTQRVEFFIALKRNDMPRIQQLVNTYPELMEIPTEWGEASEAYYFPVGINAVIWAAATGNLELLKYFQEQGADIIQNSNNQASRTLLYAIDLHQAEMVRYLLEQGISLDGRTYSDLTFLHQAVLVKDVAIAQVLIKHGADLAAVDKFGRTPVDWAILKQDQAMVTLFAKHMPNISPLAENEITTPVARMIPVGDELLGYTLDSQGQIYDQKSWPVSVNQQTVQVGQESHILLTGIKAVDFLAPLRRGGHNGIFTPLAGVGKLVLIGQIIQNIGQLYKGCVISVMLEEGPFTAENFMMGWRAMDLHENTINIAVQESDGVKQKLDAIQTAFTHADYFRQQGREVILLIESKLLMEKSIQDFLKHNLAITPISAITILYHGEHTPEAHPEFFGDLDTMITFDQTRAKSGLWPAIDPLRSQTNTLASESHQSLRQQIQTLLRRSQDLMPDKSDYVAPHDEQIMLDRAERLNQFLTQPFAIAETYTARPGEIVSLEDTLAGISAILEGAFDQTAPEELYLIGAL